MSDTKASSKQKWQERLLPFMSRTIVLLSVFFFLASLVQLIYLHYVISHRPTFNYQEAISLLKVSPDASPEEVLSATRMKSLIMLESYSLDDQYHQANVLLMGRLWTSYIGFVTGMILALVGATFILGKLSEDPSEVTSKTGPANFAIKSSSPGLILAFLGTILMFTAMITHHEIEVKHNAIYIHDLQPVLNTNAVLPPPYIPPPKAAGKDSSLNSH